MRVMENSFLRDVLTLILLTLYGSGLSVLLCISIYLFFIFS